MPKSKLIFYISLTLFCLSLLFFGIYNLAFKKTAPTPIATIENTNPKPQTETPNEAPKMSLAPILALSDEAVLAPTIASGESAIKYYSKLSGQVYQVDFDGNGKRTLSAKTLPGLVFVLWSPDKSKVITKIVNGGNANFYSYDYATLKSSPLPENIDSITWQNSNNLIFYKYFDPKSKKSTLNLSAPDGTNWKKLTDLTTGNIKIATIPGTGGLISYWNKPDAFFTTSLKTLPLMGGAEKEIFKEAYGADYLWNRTGTNALISSSDSKGGTKIQLSTINSNGGELKNLNTPTFASKCTWLGDNKTILCALPGEIPVNAVLPNDYDNGKFFTADTFWRINTQTGEKSRLIEPTKIDQKYDATNLFLNSDESLLFFQNRTDGKIYRITL
ncbi:MAG: hypothetical protein WA064_04865 [Candidatus Moraniibacteriota bacterium]